MRGLAALVTGANRGIGRATALTLAAEGCAVAIAARGEAGLSQAAAEIAAVGGQVTAMAADIMDPATPQRLVEHVQQAFGRLDILVANADGMIGERSLAASSGAEWAQT